MNIITEPVSWWGEPEIIGGKDCLAGGTWLACSKHGRLAFLTNFREVDVTPDAKTRGELPLRFLQSEKNPIEFAEEVVKEGHHYNGFNLIMADLWLESMVYVSNRPKDEPATFKEVSPGLHVLSNAKLDTPWPKATRLILSFEKLLKEYDREEIPEKEMLHKLMLDTMKADRENLPNTGCDPDWDYNLSSIFVETDSEKGCYGTRSMVALSIRASGEVSFYERYRDNDIWKEHSTLYRINSA
ncbi:transport and Golgi organization 2 homolog isoform X2 [Amborella trichopoda]|uniref:transport and Golgi organization 2 homolog isoform X2 n=1 Tax=Amborella trichopoda TaxID=13333 RepID=UPI0009BECD1B|nr:transport and Golgi organization 2 homolog isoform X2 [Amborella trichopoda]|eukprot:XP_020529930.1 transport and Golgi organization 2 homolog isoform X2 [Amborella trichopoda]